MASMKLYGKDVKAYDDIDVDALLATLTEEELEELGQELIDPDDSCIPPSERCRYKTSKLPSGPFNRKALLDFLEKKAKEEKDWDEAKPYKKEVRGKVWKRKEEAKAQVHDDIAIDTEWDEVLGNATEEELVDLAAILGFHGMLNQVQYHQAFVEQKDILGGGGFQGTASHENFKVFEDEAPNTTDVEQSLKQLKANDPKCKELNFNNIKGISIERLCEIAGSLKSNTHLEKLHLANTRSTDKVAKALAEALEENNALKTLNIESNYISGKGIVAVLEAIGINKSVTELRVSNQRPVLLGQKAEMKIAELVRENIKLLKFGIFLESPARVLVHEYLKRNNDNLRRDRTGQELLAPPPPKDPLAEIAKSRAAQAIKDKARAAAKEAAATTAAIGKADAEKEDEDDESEDESESSEEE